MGAETTRLHHALRNPDGDTTGWTLLCFDGRRDDAGPPLREAVAAAAPFRSVHPRLVLGGPLPDPAPAPLLSDMDGEAHGAYGLDRRPALVLVRPDGHIAFRDAADRADRLSAYCRRMFDEPSAQAPRMAAE